MSRPVVTTWLVLHHVKLRARCQSRTTTPGRWRRRRRCMADGTGRDGAEQRCWAAWGGKGGCRCGAGAESLATMPAPPPPPAPFPCPSVRPRTRFLPARTGWGACRAGARGVGCAPGAAASRCWRWWTPPARPSPALWSGPSLRFSGSVMATWGRAPGSGVQAYDIITAFASIHPAAKCARVQSWDVQ